jgi:hypothetical protein
MPFRLNIPRVFLSMRRQALRDAALRGADELADAPEGGEKSGSRDFCAGRVT